MNYVRTLAALSLAAAALGVHAQATPGALANNHANHHDTAAQSEGVVRKIDKAQGKLTLRHGPLKNLDMPPMTMVFKAADAKMLDGLKEGDKVMFTAEKVNGVYTVTSLQPEAAK